MLYYSGAGKNELRLSVSQSFTFLTYKYHGQKITHWHENAFTSQNSCMRLHAELTTCDLDINREQCSSYLFQKHEYMILMTYKACTFYMISGTAVFQDSLDVVLDCISPAFNNFVAEGRQLVRDTISRKNILYMHCFSWRAFDFL